MTSSFSKYDHTQALKTGILLTNLGTPDEPTTRAVRRYLAEFLWDRRVIEVPRLIWWFVLRIILLIRPARSAAKYRQVWTEQGSPLLVHLSRQADALERALAKRTGTSPVVGFAMRYGQPSIAGTLQSMHDAGVRRLLVLPLYPQYSATTSASTFDSLAEALRTMRWMPDIRFISHYPDYPPYIEAIASSIEEAWADRARSQRLLFSFHGLPKRYFLEGDPYHCECQKTARLVSERLGLEPHDWSVTFQSRLGRTEWLKPYTDLSLESWAKSGLESVDVVCPGFSADCLETLEEIEQENRDLFLAAGGKSFRYIPALNERAEHIEALAQLVQDNLQGWPADDDEGTLSARAERARVLESSTA